MANKKISQLTAATTPLAGTEVLPIVQGGSTTKVSVANLTAGRSVSAQQVSIAAAAGGGLGNPAWSADDGTGKLQLAFLAAPYAGVPANKPWLHSYQDIYIGSDANVSVNFMSGGDKISFNGANLVPAAGKGIDFSANANAPGMTSELLNWYEEGAFTPVVQGSTSAGTATYATQAGSYTRIGRLVHFQIYVVWSAGSGTGKLRVGGLPFVSGGGNLAYGGGFTPVLLDVALAANNYCSGAYIPSGDTAMRFYQTPIGGGTASTVAYDAAGEVMIVGQYFV